MTDPFSAVLIPIILILLWGLLTLAIANLGN